MQYCFRLRGSTPGFKRRRAYSVPSGHRACGLEDRLSELGRQAIRENLRMPTRQGELVLRVLLAAVGALTLLGLQLLREAAPRCLRLLQGVSVQTEGLVLGLQADEVRPSLDFFDRVRCSTCPQG